MLNFKELSQSKLKKTLYHLKEQQRGIDLQVHRVLKWLLWQTEVT